MAQPTTIAEALSLAATSPKRTKVKGTEVEEHDLDQLAKLADREASATAASRNHKGLRFNQIVPGGAG